MSLHINFKITAKTLGFIALCFGSSSVFANQPSVTEVQQSTDINQYSTTHRLSDSAEANKPTLSQHTRFATDTFIIELKTPSLLTQINKQASALKQTVGSAGVDNTPQRPEKKAILALQNQIQSEQNQLVAQLISTGLVVEVIKQIAYSNNILIVKTKGTSAAAIEKLPQVKAVHRNAYFEPTLVTRDIRDIHANDVWDMLDENELNITGQGVTVAVLDTGIDYTHPHLGGCFGEGCKVLGGYDVYNDDPDPLESNDDPFYAFIGHGTHVSGIIAAKADAATGGNNGVAPDASIYAYKVCGEDNCSTAHILTGLDMAANPDGDVATDDSVDVVNLSLGSRFGSATDIIPTTLDSLSLQGITVVVAAGNDGGFASIGGLAASKEAITVAASHRDGYQLFSGDVLSAGITTFSSLGPVRGLSYLKPDIAGPGDNIVSTCLMTNPDDPDLCSKSGTSMASPHVAGVAALIKQAKPSLSSAQIKSLLVNNATNLSNTDRAAQGAGRVDARQSILADISFAPSIVYFGDIDTSAPVWSSQQTITLSNHSDSPKSLQLSFVDELPIGVSMSVAQGDFVSVLPNDSAVVTVTLQVDFEQYDIGGQTDFTFSQRLRVDADAHISYVPIVFSKMKQLDLVYTDGFPIALSIYNNDKSYIYRYEDFGFSSLYFPYGDYSGFAMFQNYEEEGGYKILAYPDLITASQRASNVEISSASAIHKIQVNSVTLPSGELMAPERSPRFLLDISDSKAKFFNIIGGTQSIKLRLFDEPIFVNDLPEHIELRISGGFQQLDDPVAPSSGQYLLFNDVFKGLSQSHIYDIDMASLEKQALRFSPQVLNGERAQFSPSLFVHSYARYGYSNNLYGAFDPRRGSYTSGTGIGTAIVGADDRIGYVDNAFDMDLYVMPRKEYNNQYLGLYSIETRYQAENLLEFHSVLEYAQLDGNNTVMWDRPEFFTDHSQRTPLLVTPAKMSLDADFTQQLTSFAPFLFHSSQRNYLSSDSIRVNALAGFNYNRLGGDDPNITNKYKNYCDGQRVNEFDNYIFVSGICDVYSFTADTLGPFLDALVVSNYEIEVEHIDETDVSNFIPSILTMYTTQNDVVVSKPDGEVARLNIAFRGAYEDVFVEVKSDGAWQPLTVVDSSLAGNQVSAQFAVPDKAIKHHFRVTHQSNGANSVQTFNSYMIAGRDNSVLLTEDFDEDGVPDYKDQDSDNDDIDDLMDDFPLDQTETTDTDKDGVGNNADEDDDNDGVVDNEDAFPLDPTETLDSDSDGVGNNSDDDDDNDGVLDTDDAFPLDPTETVDTDNDGVGNNTDEDDDNDGVVDDNDAFPLNAAESADTDNDGVGNNADNDDDNDGVPDTDDAFPLNSNESVDTDGDGVGNNTDNDDDNDGVVDANDDFPLDPSRSQRPAPVAPRQPESSGGGSVPISLVSLMLLVVVYRRSVITARQ